MGVEFKNIKSEAEYDQAVERIEELFEKPRTPEAELELEMLVLVAHDYESRHHPILPPDPIEAIKFRMDQLGLKPKDLAEIIGRSGRVSEVLSGKRALSLSMIRKLNRKLNIPAETLIASVRRAS